MKKILLLSTMLLALVVGKAQNQQAQIQNDDNGDYVLIPKGDVNDPPTVELSLADKTAGYSIRILNDVGNAEVNPNYPYYYDNCGTFLLIKAPEGCLILLSGTVITEGTGWDWLEVFDGESNTESPNLGDRYGNRSGNNTNVVNVISSSENMLLFFRSDGSNADAGVDVTATVISVSSEGGFVWNSSTKELLLYTGEGGNIVIPSAITAIGSGVFANNNAITSVDFSQATNLTTIGERAFAYCGMESIDIPENVQTIGENAFAGLKNVVYNGTAGTINDSWGATMRNGVQEGDFFLGSNGTVIGEYLGTGGDIVIPASVQKICDNVFNDKNITSVDFSQATGLTTIGDYAFSNCDGLTTVTIPASVTTMGYGVFDGCDYISVIYCAGESRPDGWDYNWNYGYFSNYGWDHLPTLWDYTNWSIDDNGVLTFNKDYDYNSYEKYPWYTMRSEITSVKVGADVTVIGQYAFYNENGYYENLVSVDFSEATSLNTIKYVAFYKCPITSLAIPASLTSIGNNAFYYCQSLESVDFSNAGSLLSIGSSAFNNCEALTEADLENATSLTTINSQAFESCYGLKTLNIPISVSSIGYQAFQGVKNINYKGSAGSSMEKWGALARNGYVEDGFVYSDNTKTTLVAYIGDGGSVNIPAGVVTIGHLSFFNCTTLTAVSIPSSVEYIGSDAFSSCSSLSTVDMSNATNLHYIDNSAFSGCAALASISIPQSIIRVGYGAFDNCNSSLLTEQNGFYYLGNSSNPYLVLIKPVAPGNISTLTVENGVKAVAYGAFSGCTDFPITENGASYVGSSSNAHLILARASSEEITSCTINSNTKLVAPEAFWGCYGLSYTTITIPEGIEFMGYRAFGYSGGSSPYFVTNECSQPARWDEYWNYYGGRVVWGANSYQIDGDGVLTINKNVEANDYTYYPWYSEAESITKVVFAEDVSSVGKQAFYNGNNEYNNLTEVVIPSTMKTIGDNAFQYSYYLTDINLGDATELTSIGGYAFYNCSSLETIEIPSSVTFIGEYAFNDCYNMDYNESEGISYLGNTSNPYLYMASVNSGSDEQYTINANTRFIGSDAFSGCSNMSSITIPASVTSIGNYAFNNCASLISIDVPATVTYIEEYAFNGVSNVNYNGPFGTAADTWGANARNGSMDDNFVYTDATRTTIIRYIGSDTEVTIPASVKTIGNNAFEYKDITAVDFSQATQLIQIGEYAFHNTNLTEVSIPASVETIGARAFYECYSLESVDLSNASNLEIIGQYAFSSCYNLTSIVIPESVTIIDKYAFSYCSSIESIDFSNAASLISINEGAFSYCNSLTEVVIPASVKILGNSAFSYCELLTDVDFSEATSLTSISGYLFGSCPNLLCSIEIPSTVSSINSDAFNGIKNIVYDGNAGSATSKFGALTRNGTIENNFVFADEAKTNLTGYTCKSGSATIPAGVTTIGDYAFEKCNDVTVTIPSELSISSIGNNAFYGIASVINYNSYESNSPWGANNYYKGSDIDIDDEGFIYAAGTERAELIGYKGSATEIVIPSTVTSIGDKVFYGRSITSVDFSQATNLDEIGEYAFSDCDALTSVTIPGTVSTIGNYVFRDCDNLKYIKCEAVSWPENWNNYDWNYKDGNYFLVAWDCNNWSLSDEGVVTVTGDINYEDGSSYYPWYPFYSQITGVVFSEGVTAIGDYAFYNYDNLISATIPASVQSIGTEAFRDCYNLETAALNSNSALKTIGVRAFYGCYKLGNNNLDNAAGLESIGQQAFYNCDALTSVTIPAQVTTMGYNVFYDCNKLNVINCYAEKRPENWSSSWNGSATVMWDFTNWSLSDGVLSFNKDYDFENTSDYPWYAFRSQITGLDLGQNVTLIGNYAFYNCDNLESVTIPAAVTKIGSSAFNDCDNLKTVDLSNTAVLKTIGDYAFSSCDNLESIAIPASVTEIGDYAFNNCSSLATVEISDNASLTSIGDYAFAYCNTLATIDLSKATSLDEIGGYAFYECDKLTSVYIPLSVESIGEFAFSYSDNLSIINCKATSAGDNWDGNWNYRNGNYYPVAWDCTNWSLSSDGLLTVKKQYNFESKEAYPWYELRSQITGVEFDNSNTTFTSIGKYAFNGYTSLQTATIPAGVTEIGDYAFYNCSNLIVVDLDNNTTLAAIGDYAFYSCYNLQSLTIPSSVTSIGGYAFYDCPKLETIDLSKLTSLESIGNWAFYNCDQLASAYLPISVLSVGENAFLDCDDLELIYIEAESSVPDGWSSNWSNSNNVAWDCTNWSLSASGKLTIKKQFTAENAQDYPWYKLRSQITSVEFDNSNATFTAIGNYAFYGCDNLTAIDIPATVESIGNYAFYGCQKLESVELSDNASLKSIGYQSFRECNALADIDLSKATSLDEIGEEAFYNCDGLTTITIPASVTQMGSLVFNYSDNLQFISCEAPSFPNNGWDGNWNYVYNTWNYLPVLWDCNNVSLSEEGMLTVSKDYEFESYDNYPWYNLKKLIKGVTFESGVTVIGDYAFYSWGTIYPNLATVVIPATVAEIGEEAFYYCQNLTSADLKGAYGLTTIGNYAFYECGLTEITIPANVTTIEEGAFEYCSNVESINLSGATSLEKIETNAFFDCFKTFNIDVPSNVTYIGDDAFCNIKNLKYSGSYGSSSDTWGALARNAYVDGDFIYSDGTKTYLLGYTGNGGNITIPSTVVTIGDNVFYQKENITGVVISGNVMEIGSNAFADCNNLATVNLSNATNLTTIGSSAFSGCTALTSVTIPSTVTSLGSSAFSSCEKLATVNLSNATNLTTIGSSAFSGCKELTSVTIPSTVTSLGSSAFRSCEKLATADLSNATSLESIANYVFYGCAALQSIVIPSKVEYIGSYAFQNCTSLRTVNLNNATGLYHIYNNAFDGCYNLNTIDLSKATNLEYIDSYVFRDCDALTQVTIPAKVRSISDGAFYCCDNLRTINMSNAKNLTYIGYNAFQECALTSVAIPENVTEIGSDAFNGCSALRTVSIPNGIVHVGENAFYNCNNLTFTQSNGFCYLGNSQNQYVVLVKPVAAGDLSSCTVNSGVKIVAVGAFNNCTVFPTTENGACYVGNNSNPYLILARAESQDISSCTINSNTRIIAPYAFWNCYSLSSLDIPVGVEHVGYYAVGYYYGAPELNCYTGDPSKWDSSWKPYGENANWAVDGWEFDEDSGLLTVKTDVVLWSQSYYPWYSLQDQIQSVKFTDNVSRIGYEAFDYYYNMTAVDFSNASGLESIGDYAFYNCYNLNNADLSGATNLKSIGIYAFNGENLNKIVIPASVEEIGEYAFSYWYSNVVFCEADGPAEGWDDNWTTYAKIWHYNNNALTLTVNNSSYGSVRTNTVNDVDVNQVIPNGTYTYGDVVSIEAVSNSGSIFLRWNDGVTDNQRDITITDNLSLEAIFGSDGTVYAVNVWANSSNRGTVTGTGNYVSGDYVELEAVPAEHYHFVYWSDDEENTNPNRSFYIDSDVSFYAVFERDPCMVTVNVTGNGTVENETQYGYATWNTIYSHPAEGWYLAYWITPNGNYFDNNCYFGVYEDMTLTAVFKPVQNVTVGTNIVEAYGRKYNNCKFEAEVSGEYVIYGSSFNNYPYIYVYDAYGYELASASGSDRITIDLEAGETYYIGAGNSNEAIEKMQLFIMASVSITAQGNGGTFEGDGEYTYGEDVTVTATPNEGMFFVKWSDGENKNVYSLKAYGNTTLNAEFSAIHQAVEGDNTVVGFYSGVTENYNCQFTPSYSGPYVFFSQSENDTYGILYDENKTVLESDDNSGENGNFSFSYELEAGKTYYIAASYVYTGNAGEEMDLVIGTPVNVTATVDGNGSVQGTGMYAYGSKVTLRANPESGNRFVRWSDLSTANPYQFTVYEDVELQAIFVDESEDVYAVSAVVNNNSYGSVSGGSNYTAGERVELAVTANSGYTFICWTDGNSQNPRVFNASENVSLMAVLTPEGTTVHTVSATANDANMGNVTGGRYYADGETATISAVPVSGYKFVRWNDGTTTNPLVFTVTGDTEIEAMFVDESTPVYTVSVGVASASANFGSVSGGGVFISGEPVSLTASAIEHYQFVKWSNNETANPYNFNVSSNVDVAAVFEPMNYNVTVVAENGIVTNGDGPRKYGTWTTISVQPAEHYHFVGWFDGQTSTTRTEQVLGDLEFTALFEKDKYQINAWADNDATVSGTGEYEYEATATLTVTPAEGYHFERWSDDATAQNPRQIVVDKNLDLYAQTAINEYQVTVDAANGTVEGITNPYTHGSEGTFTAVPAEGYRFVRWSATNRENPFTMQITSNVVLRPLFASPDDDVYDVVVSATEGGAVTGGGIFLKDEKTTITATPDQGYHFVKWSNGKTETSFELTVTESVNLKAEFDKNVHTLTVSAGANGTVTGGGTVEAGSSAEISATAAEGYHFVKWSDGNTSASRTVVVDKDIELTAEFAINTYAVKASATNGKVEGAGNYNHGAEATLTATANAGYHFVKWSDGVETVTRKVTVKSDLSFTAEFAINTYVVKVTAANGTVTGEGTYEHGAKAKLSVTAAEGYHFVKWSDGETKATRTVVVTDNVTLTAEFEINSYTVSASATNGTVEGTGTYNYGAEATLTAVANTGYHFTKWSDGVETATRKMTVKSDLSFTAEFAVNTYTISVDSAANGTITGAGTYTYKATATLEATANKGYHFVMWTDSVMTATRTVEVTGNATFSAVFAGDSYELTVKAKNGTVEGAGTYENGTEATLTAVADPGYMFSSWDDGNTDNPRKVTVTGDKTYTATFKKALYSVTVNAENGQITGAADSLELGATVTLTAIADEGYHFVMWSDSVTENPRTVTLTAELLQQVKDSIEFTAIFEVNTDVADEAVEAVNIFAYGNTIVVENADSDIFVYNAMGRLIERVAAEAGRTEIKIEGAGIYVVKTGNTAKRVMVND